MTSIRTNVLQTKVLNKSISKMTKQFLINRIVYRSQFWSDLIWNNLRNNWYALFDVLTVSYLFIDYDWRFQNARVWKINLYKNCFTNSFYKNSNHDFVQSQLLFFNISILWHLFTFNFFKNYFSNVMFFFKNDDVRFNFVFKIVKNRVDQYVRKIKIVFFFDVKSINFIEQFSICWFCCCYHESCLNKRIID